MSACTDLAARRNGPFENCGCLLLAAWYGVPYLAITARRWIPIPLAYAALIRLAIVDSSRLWSRVTVRFAVVSDRALVSSQRWPLHIMRVERLIAAFALNSLRLNHHILTDILCWRPTTTVFSSLTRSLYSSKLLTWLLSHQATAVADRLYRLALVCCFLAALSRSLAPHFL